MVVGFESAQHRGIVTNLDFFEPVVGPQPPPEVLSGGDEVRLAQLSDRDEAQVHRAGVRAG